MHVHVGEKLKSSDERDSMIVDCLVSLGRLDEAARKLTEMIVAKPDQWAYIRTYIKCQMQRCQNFRERVRQQLERDRRYRDERDSEEDSTTESREDDIGCGDLVPEEVSSEEREQSYKMMDGCAESDAKKVENGLNSSSERPTEGKGEEGSGNCGEGGGGEEEEQQLLECSVNDTGDDVNEVTIR